MLKTAGDMMDYALYLLMILEDYNILLYPKNKQTKNIMGEVGEVLEWSRVPAAFVEARSCFHHVKLQRKPTPSSDPHRHLHEHTHKSKKGPGRSISPTSSTSRMWSIERTAVQ